MTRLEAIKAIRSGRALKKVYLPDWDGVFSELEVAVQYQKYGWYLSGWTNIAAGPDHAVWGRRPVALEFFNLKWAQTIAPLYDSKVVIVTPNKHKRK